MKHFATPEFWYHHRKLPAEIRTLADKYFTILKTDSNHLSLRLKKRLEFIGPCELDCTIVR